MDKIQAQATKLWTLIFEPETAATYQKTLILTGTILLEAGRLLWLLLCLVIVLIAWMGNYAQVLGHNARVWLTQQRRQNDAESSGERFSSIGKSLLETSGNSARYLLKQAKEQLNIELPQPVKAIAPAPPSPTAPRPPGTRPPTANTIPAPPEPAISASPKTGEPMPKSPDDLDNTP